MNNFMTESILNNSIKQRFVKDYRLPINLFNEPYFDYFLNLYDPHYQSKDRFQLLLNTLAPLNNSEEFFGLSHSLTSQIKELISNSKSYKDFNNVDLNTNFKSKNIVSSQNIYIEPNLNKELISIDLSKANFNIFRLFGLQEELNTPTYESLLKKFTNDDYFLQSKMIRQVIFGDLNPARQQKIQKFIINEFCDKLQNEGLKLSSASSDEIIIENSNLNVQEIQKILLQTPKEFHFFRIEPFSLKKIDNEHSFFVKESILDNGQSKTEFKNVPSHFFAQVYKEYIQQPLHEFDLLFYHDGYLSEFKETVFQPKLTKKNKLK